MDQRLKGFSLIEMLFAGAIFAVFAWGVVEVLLTGLELNRLGEETTQAKAYASAGIEAVRSIKAKSFDALATIEATGVERQDGEWVFAGTENVSGKFTRAVAVSEVARDGDGLIVEQDGDPDSDTKKITVTVTWDFSPLRSNSVVLDTYLTKWQD